MPAAILALLASIFFASAALRGDDGWVDLHAHLFFYEGTGVSWFGGFESPLRSSSGSSRLGTKVNFEALERSGARIVVVALYAHPLFIPRQRDSVRAQIAEARRVTELHPDWVIARSPDEAEAALAKGKKIFILSLEGAAGILENEADLREFVDTDGIRIVTLLHFADDHFGGPSLLPGLRAAVAPLGWFLSWFSPDVEEGVLGNPRGLTDAGRELVRQLIVRGVWIDLSHASDRSQAEMVPMLEAAGQPILFTHTALRKYYRSERGISEAQIQRAASRRGVVGLIPSDEMVEGAPPARGVCTCEPCRAGIAALVSEYREMLAVMGAPGMSFGTDIDAPLPLLNNQCQPGVADYGALPVAWQAIDQAAAPGPDRMSPADFLKAWRRAMPSKN